MSSAWDDVTPGRRRNMQAIRSKDTKPEQVVRRLLHAKGYRFRLHRADLPGRPDLAFPRRRCVVEVRGCFFHAHGCPASKVPETRRDYWLPKFRRTKERDAENEAALRGLGWRVSIVWECELRRDPGDVLGRLMEVLGPPGRAAPLSPAAFGSPRTDQGSARR